jgi:hypothetical protein
MLRLSEPTAPSESSSKSFMLFNKTFKITIPYWSKQTMESTTFQFLEAFSNLVTVHSVDQYDRLARTGSYSIYALLSRIVPQVLRSLERVGLAMSNEPCSRWQGLRLTENNKDLRYTSVRCIALSERLIRLGWQQLGVREYVQSISGNNQIPEDSHTRPECREVTTIQSIYMATTFETEVVAQLRRNIGIWWETLA